MADYDIITVGGGIGASALARGMAEHGCRVLVVEREPSFRDRVRGEFLFPWGVVEAKRLGVYDAIMRAGGHHPTYWVDYAGSHALPARNFAEDTPHGVAGLAFYHPRMQEALLTAAAAAGAEIRRASRVSSITPADEPTVTIEEKGRTHTVSARLVVAADGRSSLLRKWCGFESHDDPAGNVVAGVLIENVPASADTSICMLNPHASRGVYYFPQSRDCGRAYLTSRADGGVRLHGAADFERFLEECARSGLAPGLFDGATQAGPLATFDGADSWVPHPYRNRCALVGDAAATSDPSWGQGLSLTLRDARELRDALLGNDDWDAAGHSYASAHDRYFDLVHTAASWYTTLFLEPGPAADEIRARVLPQLSSDPTLLPDTLISGPDAAPPTDAQRRRIFASQQAPVAADAS